MRAKPAYCCYLRALSCLCEARRHPDKMHFPCVMPRYRAMSYRGAHKSRTADCMPLSILIGFAILANLLLKAVQIGGLVHCKHLALERLADMEVYHIKKERTILYMQSLKKHCALLQAGAWGAPSRGRGPVGDPKGGPFLPVCNASDKGAGVPGGDLPCGQAAAALQHPQAAAAPAAGCHGSQGSAPAIEQDLSQQDFLQSISVHRDIAMVHGILSRERRGMIWLSNSNTHPGDWNIASDQSSASHCCKKETVLSMATRL